MVDHVVDFCHYLEKVIPKNILELIFTEIAWEPFYKFDKKIKKTINWHLRNKDLVNFVNLESLYRVETLSKLN